MLKEAKEAALITISEIEKYYGQKEVGLSIEMQMIVTTSSYHYYHEVMQDPTVLLSPAENELIEKFK